MRKIFFLLVLVCLGVSLVGCQPMSMSSGDATVVAPDGWVSYQHPKVGLSFYYPSDVTLHLGDFSEADFDRLHTIGFAYFVHRPEGQPEDVSFYLLKNAEHLALSDFVVAQSGGLYTQIDESLPREGVLSGAVTFKVSGLDAIRLSRSENTLNLIGFGKYITFVSSGDWVVAITLGASGRNPADMDWGPTGSGQRVYDTVISTINFPW